VKILTYYMFLGGFNLLRFLSPMNYAYRGAPFVEGAKDPNLNLKTMNYAYRGAPFVRAKK
jgi:hypothetical protein